MLQITNPIVNYQDIPSLQSQYNKSRVVLTGGCFDVLHFGHATFLNEAKKQGDLLLVALESDEAILKRKGRMPIHTQAQRALMLSGVRHIDYILMLPFMSDHTQYDELVLQTRPHVIVATEGDPLISRKLLQAKRVDARLHVVPFVSNYSTSAILGL